MPAAQSPSGPLVLVCADAELGNSVAALLVGAGHLVQALERGPGVLGQLRGDPPRLAVVEVGSDADAVRLVEELRAAPETLAVPVITLGAAETLRVRVHASGNVHKLLPRPVPGRELLEAVKSALALQTESARIQAQPLTSDPAVRDATALLFAAEQELMLAWLEETRREPGVRGAPELTDEAILDQVPQVFHGLLLMLQHDEPADLMAQNEPLIELIHHHARGHHEHGLPPESIVREYQILRGLVVPRLREELGADVVLAVLGELTPLLDAAIRHTISECVRLAQADA